MKLLDFYAEWCGPCKALTPIINELIEEYESDSSIIIEKVDIDESPDYVLKYGIRTIPTIIFEKDDIVVAKINGSTNKASIISKIEEFK